MHTAIITAVINTIILLYTLHYSDILLFPLDLDKYDMKYIKPYLVQLEQGVTDV
jgi:hypothetical protein